MLHFTTDVAPQCLWKLNSSLYSNYSLLLLFYIIIIIIIIILLAQMLDIHNI